ncbi:MAG TPA: ribosome biogenesis/translation initiation ATPase RLI [Nitrososphaerales archaeon]
MVHRIAVLDKDNCLSKKCGLECIKYCPVNKMGSDCIILGEDKKALISELLCTGCGICIKKCPFTAINIINLSEELKKDKIQQYGVNGFRIYRLPLPKKGFVLGLVGRNGIGKTTAVNILSGNLIPNLGELETKPSWDKVIEYFHGSELKAHFEKIANKQLRVSTKPQAVYLVPKIFSGNSKKLLKEMDERGVSDLLLTELSLTVSANKDVNELSGGDLQRLAVAIAASKDADIYFFDEPSSYNDVFQRLAVSRVIQSVANLGKHVILVEHDLTFLDYLSNYIQILYGEAGAYGVVSKIQPSRTGINLLLDGYLPSENVRFREKPVTFAMYSLMDEPVGVLRLAEYSNLVKKYPEFSLEVESGEIHEGEVVGILGGNALGKTTFMKMIANVEKPEEGEITTTCKVSYKPQYLTNDYDGTVRAILEEVGGVSFEETMIQQILITPLNLHRLYEKSVKDLSGGELQKIAITICLMRQAEIYALDEPSAFIDVEDRIVLAKSMNRFAKSQGRAVLIIDHDIQLIDIVSDSLMIFKGEPGVKGYASKPMRKENGMNLFLQDLQVTYRRDIDTGRPRVNKLGGKLDRKQKEAKTYYYLSKTHEQTE